MFKLRDWIDVSKLSNACLYENPAAIPILEANQDKINWYWFSCNPAIFEYDYSRMTRSFTEELMQNRFHSQNVEKFESWGF